MNFLTSEPGSEPVTLDGIIPAQVDKVYRAWTNPVEFVLWFGRYDDKMGTASLDVKVGGKWRFGFAANGMGRTWFEGEYTDVKPGERLGFTWKHVEVSAGGDQQETPVSQVDIVFEDLGEETRLQLSHGKIRTEDGRKGVGGGWTRAFEQLRAILSW